MGPINYLGAMPQIDLGAQLLQGLQVGNAFAGIRQREQEQVRLQQEREAAMQAQAAYEADISAARANPTPQAFAALTLKYPKHREAYADAWKTLSTDQQQNELRDAGTLAAALQSGRPDLAEQKLTQRIETMQAAGQDTADVEVLRDQIKTNPQNAYGYLLNVVSGLPGGDKLLENLTKAPTAQRAPAMAAAGERKAVADAGSAESDAVSKAVAAKYADSNAMLDLKTKGLNLEAVAADIDYKKQSTRIAAMNAALAREGNDLKRQELQLKVDEAKAKREESVNGKVAEVESARSNIDNMLNTIERIKTSKGLNDVVGGIEGKDFYPTQIAAAANALNPFTSSGDQRADAIALIETLGSQAFLSQLPNIKGMGQLSNAEGDKLQAALQNLKRAQSEDQFRTNLDEAARLLTKGRSSIAKRYGVQETKPDTPAKPGARPPLASFER